jgi:hypothetical protein
VRTDFLRILSDLVNERRRSRSREHRDTERDTKLRPALAIAHGSSRFASFRMTAFQMSVPLSKKLRRRRIFCWQTKTRLSRGLDLPEDRDSGHGRVPEMSSFRFGRVGRVSGLMCMSQLPSSYDKTSPTGPGSTLLSPTIARAFHGSNSGNGLRSTDCRVFHSIAFASLARVKSSLLRVFGSKHRLTIGLRRTRRRASHP